jgi:hypothetical protein
MVDDTMFEEEQIPSEIDLDSKRPRCALCSQINHHEAQVRELASALLRLQKTIAPVVSRYKDLEAAHPRCAACGIMAGPDHEVKELYPEPVVPRAKGQKRYKVCTWCYTDLHKSRMSVPQEKKYRKLLADIIAKEDEELYDGLDEDTTDVLSSVLDALGQVDSDNEHNS